MEWLNGPDESNMEVDIGFIPRMELISSAPSMKSVIEHVDADTKQIQKFSLIKKPVKVMNHNTYKKFINDIKWKEEIPLDTAIENLEKSFFPFKEVIYSSLHS
jgi:hypothetical protein